LLKKYTRNTLKYEGRVFTLTHTNEQHRSVFRRVCGTLCGGGSEVRSSKFIIKPDDDDVIIQCSSRSRGENVELALSVCEINASVYSQQPRAKWKFPTLAMLSLAACVHAVIVVVAAVLLSREI
jgi:hypothetical protein